MGDLEQGKRIKQRILNSNRRYTGKERKAELLLRNAIFITERMDYPYPEFRIGHETYTIRKDFLRRARERVDPREELIRKLRDEPKYLDIRKAWLNFCYRWGVNWWWDGRKESLSRYVNTNLEVFYREAQSTSISIIGQESESEEPSYPWVRTRDQNIGKEPAFIYIKIEPWTRLEDLRSYWLDIERTKKEVFGYSEGEPSKFARDLCWFDLNKREEFGKLSYEDIRSRWNKLSKRNKNIKSRVIVQKAVERIEFCIVRLTPARRFSVPLVYPRKRPA